MIVLSATAFFWFIALGLVVGSIFGIVIKREGVSVGANIFWGVISAVIAGPIGILLGFRDGLLFCLVGIIGFLFLVNVFHQHHKEDLNKSGNFSVRIKKRSR